MCRRDTFDWWFRCPGQAHSIGRQHERWSTRRIEAEYSILQTQYEAFDGRALMIKSWSVLLLAGGVGLGVKDKSIAVIVALIVAAICLWVLEAIWKAFQYCYTDRIKLIEAWFRDQHSQEISPFQIFTAWVEVNEDTIGSNVVDTYCAAAICLDAILANNCDCGLRHLLRCSGY